MTQINEVPDDWNPDHCCCLECGNSDPDVTLQAITHPATNQQALACTRDIADVAAVLGPLASASHTAAQQVPKPATTPATHPPPTPAPRLRSRA